MKFKVDKSQITSIDNGPLTVEVTIQDEFGDKTFVRTTQKISVNIVYTKSTVVEVVAPIPGDVNPDGTIVTDGTLVKPADLSTDGTVLPVGTDPTVAGAGTLVDPTNPTVATVDATTAPAGTRPPPTGTKPLPPKPVVKPIVKPEPVVEKIPDPDAVKFEMPEEKEPEFVYEEPASIVDENGDIDMTKLDP